MEKKTSLKFIYEVSGRSRLGILFLAVAETLIGLAGVAYALVLKEIVNSAVDGRRQDFIRTVSFFIILIAVQLALGAFRRWLDEKTRSGLENSFKSRFLSCVMSRDYGKVSDVHSGELMNRLTSDTVVVANGLTGIIPGFAGMMVRLVGALVLIIVLEPRFCFLIIPGGILVILFSYLFRKKMKEFHKNVQEKDGKLRMFLQDVLGSMLVVRSYALEEESILKAQTYMKEHRKARMRRNYFSNFCNTGFGVVMNAAYVIGAAFCGYGILAKTMSYGTFMAVLQLVGQIQAPFANISGYLPQWYAMLASGERLMEAEELPYAGQIAEGDHPRNLNAILSYYMKGIQAVGLRGVSFFYGSPVRSFKESRLQRKFPVLTNFSLEIKKGEYVAFVGPSGCGKSTVLKLLLSLYQPEKGNAYIRLEGKEKPLDGSWQKLFAYVPQGNHLMSGTVREIVTLADRARSGDDEAIWTALRVACAEAFVRALANGLDTELGERGTGLSEGQMQRIAIARAIFSGHPILLLDESTSALDEQTESWLLNNLRSMTNMTVVVVTHRPAVLKICDRVIDFSHL